MIEPLLLLRFKEFKNYKWTLVSMDRGQIKIDLIEL